MNKSRKHKLIYRMPKEKAVGFGCILQGTLSGPSKEHTLSQSFGFFWTTSDPRTVYGPTKEGLVVKGKPTKTQHLKGALLDFRSGLFACLFALLALLGFEPPVLRNLVFGLAGSGVMLLLSTCWQAGVSVKSALGCAPKPQGTCPSEEFHHRIRAPFLFPARREVAGSLDGLCLVSCVFKLFWLILPWFSCFQVDLAPKPIETSTQQSF